MTCIVVLYLSLVVLLCYNIILDDSNRNSSRICYSISVDSLLILVAIYHLKTSYERSLLLSLALIVHTATSRGYLYIRYKLYISSIIGKKTSRLSIPVASQTIVQSAVSGWWHKTIEPNQYRDEKASSSTSSVKTHLYLLSLPFFSPAYSSLKAKHYDMQFDVRWLTKFTHEPVTDTSLSFPPPLGACPRLWWPATSQTTSHLQSTRWEANCCGHFIVIKVISGKSNCPFGSMNIFLVIYMNWVSPLYLVLLAEFVQSSITSKWFFLLFIKIY